MLEILEGAGASVLAAGQYMSPAAVIQLVINYHANVLCGDSSQIVSAVHHISTLPREERDRIKLDKIIYTSEALTPPQRSQIREVLGDIRVYSILGSAEAGPYAISCPPSARDNWAATSYEDFVFDTRMTRIEILPLSFSEGDPNPEPVEDGQQGVIAQTSLVRLRNPLVRYVTGDVGSLHPLPEDYRSAIPEMDWAYLRILRLQGRDRRFSFEWDGEYLEFSRFNAMMNDAQSGVLQWQIILERKDLTMEELLEVRILHSNANADATSEKDIVEQIETFFHVYSSNRSRFKLVFLKNVSGFKRSDTGRKVIKFVNNYN